MQEIELLVLSKHFLILFFLIILSKSIYSQSYPEPAVDSLMQLGIDNLAIQNYSEAKIVFTKLDTCYPKLPLGSLYLAASEIDEDYDLGNEFNYELINNDIAKAILKSEKLYKTDDAYIWNNYFMALCYGYKAYFNAIKKNWIPAFTEGLSSKSYFEKCLNINPKFYDAQIAVGAYLYWKSRKTEFLNWLPFMSNDEKEGIKLIETAITHYSYNNYLAINSLTWIYIDQHEYLKAKEIAEFGLKKFPNNRALLWGLARAYEDINKNQSIKIYKQIIDSYLRIQNQNHMQEIILKHILAQLYLKIGDKNKALSICNDILSINNLSDRIKDILSSRLSLVKKMQLQLSQ